MLNGEQITKIEAKKAPFNPYRGTEQEWIIVFHLADGSYYTVDPSDWTKQFAQGNSWRNLVNGMGEDETKLLENSPILQRVLKSQERLEAIIKTVETKIDQQGFNTKPMWEKAITELERVNENVATLSRKIDIFNSDMLNVRTAQLKNEERLAKLEA